MTIKELIEKLSDLDPNKEIMLEIRFFDNDDMRYRHINRYLSHVDEETLKVVLHGE